MAVIHFVATLGTIAGGLTLLVLPGVWVAFGLGLREISFGARLALAGALSPALVGIEFCLLRAAGFAVSTTVWVLVVGNITSLLLLWMRRSDLKVNWRQLAHSMLIYALLAACVVLTSALLHNVRLFTGHNWMHAGIIYEFSSGKVWPEDPELAGVSLAYPWLGHAFVAAAGLATGLAPTKIWVAANLVSLCWVCILVYELCVQLGASPFAARMGLLWLTLGTNVFGALVWIATVTLGRGFIRAPGDTRTIPWLEKFYSLNEMPFVLALFAALLLLGLLTLRKRKHAAWIAAAMALAGIGLMHALMFPPALGFCLLVTLAIAITARRNSIRNGEVGTWFMVGVLIAAGLVVFTGLHFFVAARTGQLLFFSGVRALAAKAVTGATAMALFLLAVFYLKREQLYDHAVLVLLGCAAISLALRAVFRVGAGYNEYKFLYSAALCLAPVACLAADRWVSRGVSARAITVASFALLITIAPPIALTAHRQRQLRFPWVADRGFSLQLGASDRNAGWVGAIRSRTPSNTIVVADYSELFIPALLERSLWAPTTSVGPVPGYWLMPEWNLVQERGYPRQLLDRRQQAVRCVYTCNDTAALQLVAAQLLTLNRPVAIVFKRAEGTALQQMLRDDGRARAIYVADGYAVWLLEPETKGPPRRVFTKSTAVQ